MVEHDCQYGCGISMSSGNDENDWDNLFGV